MQTHRQVGGLTTIQLSIGYSREKGMKHLWRFLCSTGMRDERQTRVPRIDDVRCDVPSARVHHQADRASRPVHLDKSFCMKSLPL